jgi:hypothetical protein
MAKKTNPIKGKTSKATPVLKRVKTLAKGIAQAMAGKPAKKGHTKAPSKPQAKPHSKSHSQAPAKPQPKVPAKLAKPSKIIDKKWKPEHAQKPAKPELKGKAPVKPVTAPEPMVAKGKEAKPLKAVKTGKAPKSVVLNAANAERMCRETGCENPPSTKGYCRLDYIKNWKKIKRKEMILKEGKLNQYIEELVSKYPDKYIEVIRQDLSTEVNFNKVIHDLELDESIDDLDYDGDSIDSLIGAIRKEEDDFGDTEF